MPAVLKKTIAPPYSIVFIADPGHRYTVPEIGPGLISSSTDCVAIGTLYEGDGETTFVLSPQIEDKTGAPIFSGTIAAPGKTVSIIMATGEIILSLPILEPEAHLCIWANDESEPNLVLVQIA